MVLCAIVNCGTKSDRDKGVYIARIPSVITNQGEELKKLSEERRERWISAISREDLTDAILEHGRVCAKNFVSGVAAKLWNKFDPDWVPTQNLGYNNFDPIEKLEAGLAAAAKRDERTRERELKRAERERQHNEEVKAEKERQLQEEIKAKRQKLNEPGEKVIDISFENDHSIEAEPETGTATQTEDFDYLFRESTVKPSFDESYFAEDEDKVWFYTGLRAYDVLQTVFRKVSTFVVRKSQTLSKFQEFILTGRGSKRFASIKIGSIPIVDILSKYRLLTFSSSFFA